MTSPLTFQQTIQQACQEVVTSSTLSPGQKTAKLAHIAENALPYVTLDVATEQALAQGIICDMYEGHAPFKPRYVLPDYAKFLQQGSAWLELSPAHHFDDALMLLTIIYRHVPSVTGLPVYLGCLDTLLLPYVGELSEQQLYERLKRFWITLDRTLPDAFMHANIGPSDNIICRLLLKIDRELNQVAPNLTFFYDPTITPESLLQQAIENICYTSKPHIANYSMTQHDFDERGFGVVSCYNTLPIAGGGSTLVRLNLQKIAELSQDIDDFLHHQLPYYCQQQLHLIDARCQFLYEQSHFFNESFLVQEQLIDRERFAPMFGLFALAEAVNLLQSKHHLSGRYGKDDDANQLAVTISQTLAEFVATHPVKYGWRQRALLHAQSGISLDGKTLTPGARLPYGEEPDPVNHIMIVAPHHQYYTSGISDILTIDDTIRQNPSALTQLCQASFELGFREFSANIQGNDLVRVTGYMVRKSDLDKFKQHGSRLNTTVLGYECSGNNTQTGFFCRQPRVISHEFNMGNHQ